MIKTPPLDQTADEVFYENALRYHQYPIPGKYTITPSKALTTAKELSLAYSPGVAHPCEEIAKDPLKAYDYTVRGNMVAVITNGTAVLGLGAIGALAAKPVMEGKSVLFKKFANVDSIDLELDETDVDKLVDAIAMLEPSFGGINLEDIKAPECFEIERRLRERMNIPVFHDDQHGTAIIVAAAFSNWLILAKRKAEDIRLVVNGAGAASIACLNMLIYTGLKKENIIVCDRQGVIYKGREDDMGAEKEAYATTRNERTLAEALENADAFLGLSGPNMVTAEMVSKMADAPLIMALANPTPEIMPDEARKGKPNAIVCTGRSDFPNQVNNVLCFPYIFRGALDVGATKITENMKIACVQALAALTQKEVVSDLVTTYGADALRFGPEYLIPKPFDHRLLIDLPQAVAKAAMDDGVATRPITDWQAYEEKLKSYTYRTHMVMRPIYDRAKENVKRIAYCEGESEKILRAAQMAVDDGLAKPILIGRREVVETRLKRLHLRMKIDQDFELVDPENDDRYRDYVQTYHQLMDRKGVTLADAKTIVRTDNTVIGALLVHKGDADGLVCGTDGRYEHHKKVILDVVGLSAEHETAGALTVLSMDKGTYFFCDTHVNPNPTCDQIVELTLKAAQAVRHFGMTPKIALLSHSNFGTHDDESAIKMRHVLQEIIKREPTLKIDGEMQADAALSEDIRRDLIANPRFTGSANLLITPNSASANIAMNMLKVLGDGVVIGPVLLGTRKACTIVTTSTRTRGVVNATALCSVAAQIREEEQGA